jgi:hypothetical protein
MNSKEQLTRRLAAAAIAAVGVIHLVLAPDQFDEKPYIGVLFYAGGIGAFAVAARLWFRSDPIAWSLGSVIAVGMFAGFVLSRTTGLPGFKEPDWELSGIVSLILEAGFMAALATCVQATRAAVPERRGSQARASARSRYGSPASPHA